MVPSATCSLTKWYLVSICFDLAKSPGFLERAIAAELSSSIIDEITVYINYVNTQEMQLNQAEKEKESYKNIYFIKDNKDIVTNKYNVTNTVKLKNAKR